MATTAAPEHYRNAVIAHVMVDGAANAIDFYSKAFGAEELFRLGGPGERILHAEISIHGSNHYAGRCRRPYPRRANHHWRYDRGATPSSLMTSTHLPSRPARPARNFCSHRPTSFTATARLSCGIPTDMSGSSSRTWRT